MINLSDAIIHLFSWPYMYMVVMVLCLIRTKTLLSESVKQTLVDASYDNRLIIGLNDCGQILQRCLGLFVYYCICCQFVLDVQKSTKVAYSCYIIYNTANFILTVKYNSQLGAFYCRKMKLADGLCP